MRVTDLTKQNSVLHNVNANSARMQTLQENMSTGRRINTLSDDPVGATQVQDFRTKLAFIDTMKSNIQNNYILLDRYETELQHVGGLIQNAKTLILAQANGNADEATRRVTSEEISAIIDGLIESGNSKIGKLFVFSGTETFTRPLELNDARQPAIINDDQVDMIADLAADTAIGAGAGAAAGALAGTGPLTGAVIGAGAGVVYNLLTRDSYSADFVGHSRNPYVVKITKPGPFGRAHYVVSDDGGETWSKERTLLRRNDVFNAEGKFNDRVFLRFKDKQDDSFGDPLLFPVGLEFHFDPNPPVAYKGNDVIKMVPTAEGSTIPINLTARQVYFQREADPDSTNVFDLLFTLKQALIDDDQGVLEERLDELDQSFGQVLNRRADVGATRRELELRFEKLLDRELTKTKQLADVEDLDFQEAVVELNLAEVRNRASLDTGARLLQPSLLDFLR